MTQRVGKSKNEEDVFLKIIFVEKKLKKYGQAFFTFDDSMGCISKWN